MEYSWCINQEDLRIPAHEDAKHAKPRSLRLGRNDRNLGAGQPIKQRGLARIRRPQNRRKPAPHHKALYREHEPPMNKSLFASFSSEKEDSFLSFFF
jgi:hypothetical protein